MQADILFPKAALLPCDDEWLAELVWDYFLNGASSEPPYREYKTIRAFAKRIPGGIRVSHPSFRADDIEPFIEHLKKRLGTQS